MDRDILKQLFENLSDNAFQGQDTVSTEEDVEEVTIIKDISELEDGFIGGKRKEEYTSADGSVIRKKETVVLVNMCVGPHAVAIHQDDSRYPYFAGYCSLCRIPACNLHLQYCDEPGCGLSVCSACGFKYDTDGHFKCRRHFALYQLKKGVKFFTSLFYNSSDTSRIR
jgi:hypothetical protein